MELTREWVTVRASIALTFAVAVLSILAGLAQIGGLGVDGPLARVVPDFVRQTVGFTGTITGFAMLGSGFALRNGYRGGWYSTAVLLPLTAIQGLMQASVLSFPLVALSVLSVPPLLFNRGRFDRTFSPSPTQLASRACSSIVRTGREIATPAASSFPRPSAMTQLWCRSRLAGRHPR